VRITENRTVYVLVAVPTFVRRAFPRQTPFSSGEHRNPLSALGIVADGDADSAVELGDIGEPDGVWLAELPPPDGPAQPASRRAPVANPVRVAVRFIRPRLGTADRGRITRSG